MLSRCIVPPEGFAPKWIRLNRIEIRMTGSMSPRAKATLAAMRMAFTLAIITRSSREPRWRDLILGLIERVLDPWQEWARSAGRASGGCGLYRPVWATGISDATDFVLAIFLLADAGLPRAPSSDVDTGSREENATKQKDRASVLIPSKPKRR
jgi:hypothetical protein